MATEGIPFLAITGFITIGIGLVILLWGYWMARNNNFSQHRQLMIVAVVVLFAFLIQYIVRAFVLGQETPFQGPDFVKYYIYLPILAVHITFAIITIFLIIKHLYTSLKKEQKSEAGQYYFPKDYRSSHRKFGRTTFYLWLFSYLGGIIIFLMLYVFYSSSSTIIF